LSKDSYRKFDDLIHKAFQSKTKESCEVTFNKYRVDSTTPSVLDDEGNALLLYTYIEAIVSENSNELKLILLDITERKWAEDQIEYLGRSWQTTFNAIKDSIFLLDPNEIILRANNASLSLFNLREENILGKHCYEVVHNSQYPIDGCPLLKSKLSKQRESMLLPINDKWFEVTVDPILD
jgi:PAS domain-containing protein